MFSRVGECVFRKAGGGKNSQWGQDLPGERSTCSFPQAAPPTDAEPPTAGCADLGVQTSGKAEFVSAVIASSNNFNLALSFDTV